MEENITKLLVEIRDHPSIETSTGLHVVIGELVDEMCLLLKKKSERSKKAHEGYILWKARSLNYAQIIMDIRRRKAAADSKGKMFGMNKFIEYQETQGTPKKCTKRFQTFPSTNSVLGIRCRTSSRD